MLLTMLLEKCLISWWNKTAIRELLRHNNISFNQTTFKTELLGLVSRHKVLKKYGIDDSAERCGHIVLRLLLYHCIFIFNFIELIWRVAKLYYSRHIGRDGYPETRTLNM